MCIFLYVRLFRCAGCGGLRLRFGAGTLLSTRERPSCEQVCNTSAAVFVCSAGWLCSRWRCSNSGLCSCVSAFSMRGVWCSRMARVQCSLHSASRSSVPQVGTSQSHGAVCGCAESRMSTRRTRYSTCRDPRFIGFVNCIRDVRDSIEVESDAPPTRKPGGGIRELPVQHCILSVNLSVTVAAPSQVTGCH